MAPTPSPPPEDLGKWPGEIVYTVTSDDDWEREPTEPKDIPNGWRKPRHGKHARNR